PQRARRVARRQLERRVERGERHGGIRRMHDVTRSALENRVVLVLAVARVTCTATVLETGHSASQIPTARPLAEIAAQRAHVAECGRSHNLTRVREDGEAIADSGLTRDVVQPRTGSEAQGTTGPP